MTRFVIVGASLLWLAGFAGSAAAADLAARPYVKAPVAAAVHNWTGFYIGANGGYGWARQHR